MWQPKYFPPLCGERIIPHGHTFGNKCANGKTHTYYDEYNSSSCEKQSSVKQNIQLQLLN